MYGRFFGAKLLLEPVKTYSWLKLRNTCWLNSNLNKVIVIWNAFEDVVCKIGAIMNRVQRVIM